MNQATSHAEQAPCEARVDPAALTPGRLDVVEEYAVVEIFGHRRHVGRVLEVERFGAKMLRVDVPVQGDFGKGYLSHFYGGSSIFSLTPCDLATVRREGERHTPPALAWQGCRRGGDDEDDDGFDRDVGA